MSYSKSIIFCIFFFTLYGCGGGDSDESVEQSFDKETISINSRNDTKYIVPNTLTSVDAKDIVIADSNQELIIDNIEPYDNNCIISNVNGLKFDVISKDISICRIKYKAKPKSSRYQGEGAGIIQFVSSYNSERSNIPPISKTIRSSEAITLNKTDLNIKDGFDIDASSIFMTSDIQQGDEGSVIADFSSITYQSTTDTFGYVTIYFSAIDVINNVIEPGIIYISIGQKNNQSPVALSHVENDISIVDGVHEFSISSLISDADGDSMQLIYLSSNKGFSTVKSNESFEYHPSKTGDESITYIISDHNGGYGIGTIFFNINSYNNIVDDKQDLIFFPPYTMNDLIDSNVMSGTFFENGLNGISGLYPTFNKDLADSYCLTSGSELPTNSQLVSLFKDKLKKPIFDTDYKWHSSKPFLTSDGDGVSLIDGSIISSPSDGYMSCVYSTKSKNWMFSEKIYKGSYNNYVSLFLTSKLSSGTSIFLPVDEYNLDTKIISIKFEGVEIPDSEISNYIDHIDSRGNTINVSLKKWFDSTKLTLNLEVTDPIASNSSNILYGISKCPANMDPELSEHLMCINSMSGKGVEKFTLALSNMFLQYFGIANDDINSLGTESYGKNNTSFRGIWWSGEVAGGTETSPTSRAHWLKTLSPACEALNAIKFDGRDNWTVGSSNIPNKFVSEFFTLNPDDAASAKNYVSFIRLVDNNKFSPVFYGQGYVPSDVNKKFFVNQNSDLAPFLVEGDMFGTAVSFPSCWSGN
ncbi:Ig-like domain-containing protein [Photobacterium damselae]|uniref:Ig-like domain-containing protein n=1 Tax=Photobacterium damselae TaxID=38293 RepID=UPI0040681EF6